MKKIQNIVTIVMIALLLFGCGGVSEEWQKQYDLGVRYLSEHNYEEAIIAFTAAIEIDARQALAYVGRGEAHMASDNMEAAIADFEKSIDLDKKGADAYYNLVDAYIMQGDYESALAIQEQGYKETSETRLQREIRRSDYADGKYVIYIREQDETGLIRTSMWFENDVLSSWDIRKYTENDQLVYEKDIRYENGAIYSVDEELFDAEYMKAFGQERTLEFYEYEKSRGEGGRISFTYTPDSTEVKINVLYENDELGRAATEYSYEMQSENNYVSVNAESKGQEDGTFRAAIKRIGEKDGQGNGVKEIELDEKGIIAYYAVHHPDTKENLYTYYDENGGVNYSERWEYEANIYTRYDENERIQYVQTLDDGKVVKSTHYDKNGEVEYTSVWNSTSNNYDYYNANGDLMWTWIGSSVHQPIIPSPISWINNSVW